MPAIVSGNSFKNSRPYWNLGPISRIISSMSVLGILWPGTERWDAEGTGVTFKCCRGRTSHRYEWLTALIVVINIMDKSRETSDWQEWKHIFPYLKQVNPGEMFLWQSLLVSHIPLMWEIWTVFQNSVILKRWKLSQ